MRGVRSGAAHLRFLVYPVFSGRRGILRAADRERPGAQDREFRLTFASVGGSNRGTMELRSLHYFVRIAELGSITRASAHLHVAQPALTRHVQRLQGAPERTFFPPHTPRR